MLAKFSTFFHLCYWPITIGNYFVHSYKVFEWFPLDEFVATIRWFSSMSMHTDDERQNYYHCTCFYTKNVDTQRQIRLVEISLKARLFTHRMRLVLFLLRLILMFLLKFLPVALFPESEILNFVVVFNFMSLISVFKTLHYIFVIALNQSQGYKTTFNQSKTYFTYCTQLIKNNKILHWSH